MKAATPHTAQLELGQIPDWVLDRSGLSADELRVHCGDWLARFGVVFANGREMLAVDLRELDDGTVEGMIELAMVIDADLRLVSIDEHRNAGCGFRGIFVRRRG